MPLQTERSREAQNTLRCLVFPDFGIPRRNVKGSFDFLCPLPTPCPGTARFISMGWEVWLGWGATSYPLLSQTMAITLTTHPSLPPPSFRAACRNGQPALHGTEVNIMSPWLPGAPLGHGLAHKVLLNSHATVDLRKCFYARTVASGLLLWDCHIGTVALGLSPWDCHIETVTLGPRTSPRPPDFKTSCKNTFRKKNAF